MSKRIAWIDILRAIGIILVTLVHTGRISGSFIEDYIKVFFIPLFFFISGLLVKSSFYEQKFTKVLGVLTRRIIVPYFFFATASYLLWLCLIRHFKSQSFYPAKHFLGILYASTEGGWLSYNIALWFFSSLFIVNILFFFTHKLRDNRVLFYSVILLSSVVGYVCPVLFSLRFPWNIGISFTGLVFFSIGYLLSPQVKKRKFIGHNKVVAAASLILWTVFTYLNSTVEFYIGDFGNYFFFYIAAFSGIFLFSFIANLASKIHYFDLVLSEVGQRTLTIFSTHLLIFPFISGFLVYVIDLSPSALESGFLIAFLYSFIAISCGIVLSLLLNRYAPQLVGRSG